MRGSPPGHARAGQRIIATEIGRHGDKPNSKSKIASDIFGKMMLDADFSEFLTLPAYEYLD